LKKVLIISYYWPPAGGISVLRTLKFAKYLNKFGWEPVIYAPKNANYPYLDQENFKDLPPNITVIRKRIIEPFGLFKLLTGRKKNDSSNPVYAKDKTSILDNLSIWIRGNFFIPDARYLWIKPSVRFLKKYLIKHPVDAILTDGPPHTNTVIGMQLSQKFHLPFLADFQDPWTQVDYYKMMKIGKHADKKHHKLEQAVFKTAKKITIASPTWAKDMESIGAKNVDVIYYGYDEDDFKNINNKKNSNEFIIAHAGILGMDRNPDIFFEALASIKKENPEFAKQLKIKFAGIIDYSIKEHINMLNLNDNFEELGNIPRKDALQLMAFANLLLLPINKADNARGRIPGKIYEYLRTYNPVLALGLKGSDVETILNNSKGGRLFTYDDFNGIKDYILKIFSNGFNYKIDKNYIKRFSSENQTKQIAKYLDEITR